ncbi:MAG: beta-glucosidase BglX [Bacteroidales bacterium]|nr:beta-glucosidase BglX [Bacteroidales bacterium]
MYKQFYYSLLTIVIFSCALIQVNCQIRNSDLQMNILVDSLLKEMTIEEKLGQLNLISNFVRTGPFANKKGVEKMKDGSAGNVFNLMGSPSAINSQLKLAKNTQHQIPFLSGLDIIHGFKTVFPIPLGMACTWDTSLIQKTARIAAIEGSAWGYNWTFSPMVDIARDPRWGRVMEGAGEDPLLGSKIARAMVKGYQGDDLSKPDAIMACVKHFALYGAAEAGRDYNIADMSSLTMYQNYLPPYKAAIEAGAGSVMASFNEINGVPATSNKWLLTDLLRNEWKYNGFVVTDYNAIQELINHGVATDYKEASEKALTAGVDMDMVSEGFVAFLKESLHNGEITTGQIDTACRRVLEAKYKLGLFRDPYKSFRPDRADSVTLTAENKEIARLAAEKSFVLLKNEKNVLPLKRNVKIALIGPFANDRSEMLSSWSPLGDVNSIISIYEGLKKVFSNVEYTQGTQVNNDSLFNVKRKGKYDISLQKKLVSEALSIAKKSDVIVAVLGESKEMSGEAKSRADISIPACQVDLLKALRATGKPVVLLIMSGRPLTIENVLKYSDAILMIWRPGTEAGNAVANVLTGSYNPSGKLTMTFPRSVGQIPIYYNHKNTGRPYVEGGEETYLSNYMDEHNTPLFPFGYGLSYTTFQYENVKLSDTLLTGNDKILKASIKVHNAGKTAGEETVQLYLADPVASVTRPVKELKQFQKVFLQPGESKEVVFNLTVNDLMFYNNKLNWDWEAGGFIVFIGGDSQSAKQAEFVWKK